MQLFPETMKSIMEKYGNNEQKKDESKKEEIVAPKEEVKVVEKKSFDIELISIDAAKKLNIIKELKNIFNFGLAKNKWL